MTILDFFPYPFVVSVILLAVILVRQRRRGSLYLVALAIFGVYLMAVARMIAFPILIPDNWLASPMGQITSPGLFANTNLIPFNYGGMWTHFMAGQVAPYLVLREIVGNILLTVPLGAGLGLFTTHSRRQIFWLAAGTGLALEGSQLLIRLFFGPNQHSVDINDVLLNALGVWLGFELYQKMKQAVGRGAKVRFAE